MWTGEAPKSPNVIIKLHFASAGNKMAAGEEWLVNGWYGMAEYPGKVAPTSVLQYFSRG